MIKKVREWIRDRLLGIQIDLLELKGDELGDDCYFEEVEE